HEAADAVRAEDAQQVVLEREVEARAAGVALAPRAAAELVVDAPGLVALGADDVEAAELDDLRVLLGDDLGPLVQGAAVGGGLLGRDVGLDTRHGGEVGLLLGEELGVAAEEDV